MDKFDIFSWGQRLILEQEEDQTQQQPSQQNVPQQNQQQMQPNANDAFRSLSGKTISGVTFKPNGDSGGVISILTKNSYIPFKISWVNQTVTITDLNGNIINIGE